MPSLVKRQKACVQSRLVDLESFSNLIDLEVPIKPKPAGVIKSKSEHLRKKGLHYAKCYARRERGSMLPKRAYRVIEIKPEN
jgi:hypothetical protein